MRLTAPLCAALVGLGSLSLIAGAWFFQLVVDLHPCPLCLEQRLPHYLAIPLALVTFLLMVCRPGLKALAVMAMLCLAGLMIWTSAIGSYHAGVEWKWWEGPDTCAAPALEPLAETTEELLAALEKPRTPSCGDIAWSFLGISLAGYNAIFSMVLVILALIGLFQSARLKPKGEGAD